MRFDEHWKTTLGEPFEFEGELVYPGYHRQLQPGTLIDVEFVSARAEPPQALLLTTRRTKGTKLAWDEQDVEGHSIRLWADKQQRATLRYVNPRKTAEITIMNEWLLPSRPPMVARAMAWSGMRIEENADTVVLRCSGNSDAPDFADLTAQLTFRRS